MNTIIAELRRRWLLVLFALVVLVAVVGPRLATFYTDVLWYQSIGFADVFWNLLQTRFGLGAAATVVMVALLGTNLFLARRLTPEFRIPSEGEEVIERYRRMVTPIARPLLVALTVVVALLSGSSLFGEWRTFLLWANGGSFGIDDPHFGLDLGFFVFDLPFWTMINSWLFTALTITILLTAGAHYLFGGIRPQSAGQKITSGANVHVSVLLASLIAVRAWGFWLDRYMLSYSDRGLVTGLSYTDVNAELRAFELLTIIAAVCVVLFLANIRFRGAVLPTAGVGILLVASLLLGGIYPAVIQAVQVNPQELDRERPFIERNLEFTRYAWGIETEVAEVGEGTVSYERFPASENLTREDVEENAATLEAIRLWDPATLQNTYQQLQELRPYYEFRDVDVDRYEIEGDPQQVMISVREISIDDLQEPSWQNQRLEFTHGYGVVASVVSTAASNGQPEFLARDIPNRGVAELELEEPRIYFGERPPSYSIVNATLDEFDFETETRQERNRYDGADGVNVGGILNRVAFALRYGEPNIVLSGLIQPDSRIMFNRSIQERVEAVAPFVQLDHDPYPIVVDGEVKWVQDAYTTTDMIPYSERLDLADPTRIVERQTVFVQQADGSVTTEEQIVGIPGLTGQANYIRNSVKAVVDAYDGTVELYVNDPDDPLIQAWDRAFPGVLTPMEEIDPAIKQHFRYPEDMFRVQSELLQRYHIPDADGFYNASDEWELPSDNAFADNNGSNITRTFPPTYQLIRLPGEEEEDFSLIQPFTPADRDVLSAYLAASGDPDNPELRVLQMPPTETVFGPEQIHARIQQDADVSELITLLGDAGSSIILGNLIVVPIEESLLYAQPLFLKSDQSDIPELRRVILVYGDRVVMEPRLDLALETLFGDLEVFEDVPSLPEPGASDEPTEPIDPEVEPIPEGTEAPSAPVEVDGDAQSLIARAIEAFAAADEALAAGDLGTYQEQVEQAQDFLEALELVLDAG